jgi:putative salt-induced outer membrane protein
MSLHGNTRASRRCSFISAALLVSSSGFSLTAHAQWTAKAEAGAVAARGNTTTDSANVKLDVAREFERWKHALSLAAVYASDEMGATGQRWEGRGQSDYKFHPKGFWFGSARYEEDRFSGFEYQTTYGTGLGWRFYDDPITKFVVQLGAGYKASRKRDAFDEDGITFIPSERQEELIAQFGVDLQRELTPTTKVVNEFLVETGANNTFIQNEFSVQVKILESLALAVGYAARYNTEPPEGFEELDTLTTLNLVYELK